MGIRPSSRRKTGDRRSSIGRTILTRRGEIFPGSRMSGRHSISQRVDQRTGAGAGGIHSRLRRREFHTNGLYQSPAGIARTCPASRRRRSCCVDRVGVGGVQGMKGKHPIAPAMGAPDMIRRPLRGLIAGLKSGVVWTLASPLDGAAASLSVQSPV